MPSEPLLPPAAAPIASTSTPLSDPAPSPSSSSSSDPLPPSSASDPPVRQPPPASRRPLTAAEIDALLHSAHPKHPPVSRIAKSTPELPDERCWIRCRQSNARRALGREPQCKAWCYINMREQIKGNLLPVPGVPGAFVANASSPPSPTSNGATPAPSSSPSTGLIRIPPTTPGKDEQPLPAYHWPWLDGRYIYTARGRRTVTHHMGEMTRRPPSNPEDVLSNVVEGGEVKTAAVTEEYDIIKTISERCEGKKKESAESRAERDQRALRRAVGLEDDEEYERLISLSDLYSNSLQRFHAHLLRIYSPVFRNLARLPTTLTDGTQTAMAGAVWTKLTDGSAFSLIERMATSLVSVSGTLRDIQERRKNGGAGGGAGGMGSGGLPPLVPPSAGAGPSASM